MGRLNGDLGRILRDDEWLALQQRAPAAGVYGVLTTGIVCEAGCPARCPLRQNVRIFETVEAALAAGFRRCKRCGAGPTEAGLPRA